MSRRAVILSVFFAVNAALLGGFALAASRGWPGAPDRCIPRDTCFCEGFREGPVRQPSNTFSNLGFLVVGLACALHAIRNGRPGEGRLLSTAFYPALFCAALGALGPGSMFLHGGMTAWAGRVDVASMYAFMGVCVALSLSRRYRWRRGAFLAVALACLAVPLAAEAAFEWLTTEVSFGVLIALFLYSELGPQSEATRLPSAEWLKRSAFFFFTAFFVWNLSRKSTSPLCDPSSLLQGHAFWHLFCALGAGCLYPYLLQERAGVEDAALA